MARILKHICTLCGGQIPEKCDGKEFKLVEYNWSRNLCKGRDGIFLNEKDGKYYYHFVRGHGQEWDTEVIEVNKET